jgi:Tol biopolymer transport system component
MSLSMVFVMTHVDYLEIVDASGQKRNSTSTEAVNTCYTASRDSKNISGCQWSAGSSGILFDVTWSPDSSKVAYAVLNVEPEGVWLGRSDHTGRIGILATNGQRWTDAPVRHAEWSNIDVVWNDAGSRLAYQSRHESGVPRLYVFDLDSRQTVVVSPAGDAGIEVGTTKWLDGSRLRYCQNADGQHSTFEVNGDGSGTQKLHDGCE